MEANFPFVRSLVIVRKSSCVKKTGVTSQETRFYISSQPPETYQPSKWLDLIRGHWGGVEIRNHWKRDAIMGEDGSRTRKPNILANLAIIRSALFAVLPDHFPDQPLPQIRETLQVSYTALIKVISS